MPAHRHAHRRARTAAATFALLTMVATGCGTRMSHDAVVAANGGGAGATAASVGQDATQGGATGGGVQGGGAATNGGALGTETTTGTGTTGNTARAGTGTSGSTSTAHTSGGQAASKPASGAPLLIGSVGDYSGIAGASEKDGPRALQIWAQWVNSHGGVNGHPVKVFVVDDGMDPSRYQAAIKDLVENKHVIAFVDNFAPFTLQAGVSYLERKKVPVIGGDCAEYAWNTSPMLFPQCPSYVNGLWGIVRVGAVHGKGKKFGAIICSEAAACTNTKTEWFSHGLAKDAGMDPVFEADVSIGQPDFTAECLNAQNAGVQVMSVVADVNTVARVVTSCDRQGFHPQYVQGSGTMDAHLATLPGMDGALVALNDFPWTVTSNPGVRDFLDAYQQFAPDDPLTPNASQAWASALVFAKAARNVSATPTSADILNGLWAIRNDTFGGLTSPLTFVQNKPAPPAKCSFWMQVRGAKMVAPGGLERICRS